MTLHLRCSMCGEPAPERSYGACRCGSHSWRTGGPGLVVAGLPNGAPTKYWSEAAHDELVAIHAVIMNVGGDWPDNPSDPYTLRHVKWMARELGKRTQAGTGRDKFEAWARSEGLGGQIDVMAWEWKAWQAALASKPSPSSAGVPLPAGLREWKCGNEFAPYHPQASHVNPDHRDGWNACYEAGALIRSRVADLLHLLEFAEVTTPSVGDFAQAIRTMAWLRIQLGLSDIEGSEEAEPDSQSRVLTPEAAGQDETKTERTHHTGTAGSTTPAARDVLAERQRQVSVEGWTAEHDDEHVFGDIPIAAACLAVCGTDAQVIEDDEPRDVWGLCSRHAGDTRRCLVIAGALILAEIERLDRAATTHQGSDGSAEESSSTSGQTLRPQARG